MSETVSEGRKFLGALRHGDFNGTRRSHVIGIGEDRLYTRCVLDNGYMSIRETPV